MLDRRHFLKLSAIGAAATSLGALGVRGTSAVQDGQTPRLQWLPTSTEPQITWIKPGSQAETELLHPTLLPLRHLTGNPSLPAWVLFAWHHDSQSGQHLHRWGAPAAEGPYTHLGAAPVPTPPAPTYDPNHMSSGDIVWDRANGRLVSNPHGATAEPRQGNAEPDQISFLIESRDGGATWGWLDGDPRIRLHVGAVGAPDSIHTGYGRLLRDLDGELATYQGKHWWIYRAQRRDAGWSKEETIYTPWLASAPSLSAPWIKEPAAAFAGPTGNRTLIGFDSFLLGAGVPTIQYTVATPVYGPTTQWFNQAPTTDLAYVGPGIPVALPILGEDSLFSAGTNLVRDPVTKQQYLVHLGYGIDPARIGTNATLADSTYVRVFRAAVA